MSESAETTEAAEEIVAVTEIVGVAEEITAEQTPEEVTNGNEETEDQKLKRKRDGDDNESADAKRTTVQSEAPAVVIPVAVSAVTSNSIISSLSPAGDSEMISIAPDKVGQIIGTKVTFSATFIHSSSSLLPARNLNWRRNLFNRQGAVIQDMQTRTGAKIFLNQDFPAGVNRQVSISGTPAQVKAAGDLIKLILEHGPTAIHVNR